MVDKKHCLYCGKMLPEAHGNRRRFCNDACKMRAYRKRKHKACARIEKF